ncbi:hypothetical protein [Nitrosovibrio sp. Nv6]|uniref:hypothetical protein n=1 Tax=Nitrosovibrio sp. Nv6 TaxID=1855340 RepID=UPI0008C27CCF|nr:hypothetical protein [Nitrosovibrio sp. Nv6]SEP23458.1 hypothetical protein SAMN05216316_2065 [Nitrosovibrio sp. Nv6]
MQKMDISTVCEHIAVQKPYFAFNELEKQGAASVRGTFVAEQHVGYERGPLTLAEAGRHLAILGSCAAMLKHSGQRTYYLATKGHLRMLPGAQNRRKTGIFKAVAEVISEDRRSLIAEAVVMNGEPIAFLHCEYKALPESVFSRLFKHYQTDPVAADDSSPYKEPIALEFESPMGLSLIAHSRPLSVDRFAGHFPEYPTWPVAIMAEAASQVRSKLLHHILNDEVDYTVIKLDIDALHLVAASEPLTFQVECVFASHALSHYVFSTRILRGTTVTATLQSEVYV